MKKKINVLSLFDGMSCGQIALKQAGIPLGKYYASEVDKFAIFQTLLNFPDTICLGDVCRWREWDVNWADIDLILAGSPCQGFSYAGKQLAFDDPRSRLFFVFIDILNHIRGVHPNVFFLLENVRMKRAHMRVISEYCGIFPVNINSSLVSAQCRDRWYWTNIRTRKEGLFGELHSDIPLPEDRGIILQDILEKEVGERYFLSRAVVERVMRRNYSLPQVNPRKTGALLTKNNSSAMSMDSGTTFISVQGKSRTLRTGGISATSSKHNFQFIHMPGNFGCAAMRGREKHQRLELQTSGKTNCLTTVQKDNLIILRQMKESSERSDVRRLTPTECARLQTVPDWYRWGCSDTQIYKMLGNGWTVDVIAHILSYMK